MNDFEEYLEDLERMAQFEKRETARQIGYAALVAALTIGLFFLFRVL
jgi:hypothetical protein